MRAAYLLDRKTLKIKQLLTVTDIEEVIGSIWDEKTSIETVTDIKGQKGDLIAVDQRLHVIDNIAYSSALAKITASDFFSLFNRLVFYRPENAKNAAGGNMDAAVFAAKEINRNFVTVGNKNFAHRWLTVNGYDGGGWVAPITDKGLYSPRAYLAYICRAANIRASYRYSASGVVMDIRLYKPLRRVIDFSNRLFSVREINLASQSVSCVTYYDQSGQSVTFYRNDDPRADGTWEAESIDDLSDAPARAAARFSESAGSCKIEFYGDDSINFMDRVSVRLLDGQIVDTYIASKKMINGRALYRCGDVPTTLTDDLLKEV